MEDALLKHRVPDLCHLGPQGQGHKVNNLSWKIPVEAYIHNIRAVPSTRER